MSIPWIEAWHEALYGPDGLYVRDEPHTHFSTATSPGLVDVLAAAVVALMQQHGLTHFVDVAAGGGELATAVCDLAPELNITCIEVRPRPARVPERIRWIRSPGGAALPGEVRGLTGVLVLAHEWLDNVPCVIAQRVSTGEQHDLLEVCVTPDGTESTGSAVATEDADWAARWWPEGGRVEIGRTRDEAWADLVRRIDDGLAVAVDYGHTIEARPEEGSLTAYRGGVVVDPVPDGSADLTAHVAVDSLEQDRRLTQRELFVELSLVPAAPTPEQARRDPGAYLTALARRSAAAALVDPGRFGGFWWVFRRV